MDKAERIQAIERIINDNEIKHDFNSHDSRVKWIATAIEEAIGVDAQQIQLGLITAFGDWSAEKMGKKIGEDMSYVTIRNAKAISTNKEVIKINE